MNFESSLANLRNICAVPSVQVRSLSPLFAYAFFLYSPRYYQIPTMALTTSTQQGPTTVGKMQGLRTKHLDVQEPSTLRNHQPLDQRSYTVTPRWPRASPTPQPFPPTNGIVIAALARLPLADDKCSLLCLPTELQLLILKHLERLDACCLRLTCRYFSSLISAPTTDELDVFGILQRSLNAAQNPCKEASQEEHLALNNKRSGHFTGVDYVMSFEADLWRLCKTCKRLRRRRHFVAQYPHIRFWGRYADIEHSKGPCDCMACHHGVFHDHCLDCILAKGLWPPGASACIWFSIDEESFGKTWIVLCADCRVFAWDDSKEWEELAQVGWCGHCWWSRETPI